MLFALALVAYAGLIIFLIARERNWRVAAAFLVAAPFDYVFALLGVPAYFTLRQAGWVSLWQVTIAAAILGFVAGLLIELVGGAVTSSGAYRALVFGAYGAVTGLAFWLIAFAGAKPNSTLKSRRSSSAA